MSDVSENRNGEEFDKNSFSCHRGYDESDPVQRQEWNELYNRYEGFQQVKEEELCERSESGTLQ